MKLPPFAHAAVVAIGSTSLACLVAAPATFAQESPGAAAAAERQVAELKRMLEQATPKAAPNTPVSAPADKDKEKDKDKPKPSGSGVTDEPVVTAHAMTLGGSTIHYNATAGYLPIRGDNGEAEAHVFFVAYTRSDADPKTPRPLTFAFNGGPGSASVWLHLGALGPKRVDFPDRPDFPAPPFKVVDNPSTWLGETDLVFIDPVGTGFSRAVKPELNRKFHGLQGDLDSVAEFIRMYLTRNSRWGSPIFVAGESYGTTRAAGLSERLVDRGIAVHGIVLISTVLNFLTISNAKGNDLPFILYLPTYTATAWYHKKLAPELMNDRAGTIAEAVRWAEGPYATMLFRGDRLSADQMKAAAQQYGRLTGLDPTYVLRSDLRVDATRFRKELLRDRAKTVGRLDSRFLGFDESDATDRPEDDPSNSAIRPAFTSAFAQYIRDDLNFKTDVPYYVLGEGVGPWDFGTTGRGLADTSEDMRQAFTKNPHLRVLVASGDYDLATPFAAADYTLAHSGLDPSVRDRISVERYESGHMMYLHAPSLAKLKADFAAFAAKAVAPPPGQ